MLLVLIIFILMGILGIFVGISYFLFEFNINDLDKSILILFDGMKIVFLISVIGMIFFIFLKILMLILGKENEVEEN